MIRRRLVFHALGLAVAAPFAAFAQQQSKVFKIGWLTFGSAESNKLLTDTFEEAMRKLGYVDGKNVSFDRGFADGNVDRLPALAAGLVQRDPDVLYVANNAGSIALKRATSTILIVFATVNDPVAIGLAASLARPGGNATGVSTLAVELIAKRLQLLKEAFPQLSRVAVLIGPELPIVNVMVGEVQRSARLLGLDLLLIETPKPDDIERSLTQIREWRAGAIFVMDSGFLLRHRKLVFDLATRLRLPAIFATGQFVEEGGLMCYGADYVSQVRSAAGYVHKILNGAKPADLPVEQATEFDLAINLKTAKALGIKFPQSVLLRATKVIE